MPHLATGGVHVDGQFIKSPFTSLPPLPLPLPLTSLYPLLPLTLTSPHPHFPSPSLPLTLTSLYPSLPLTLILTLNPTPHFSSLSLPLLTLYLCTCSWSMGFPERTGAERKGTVFGWRATSLTRIYDTSEFHRMPS